MSVKIKITQPALYERQVSAVDTNKLKAESDTQFTGLIEIHRKHQNMAPFYGLIEADDFEREYGFQLVSTHY